MALPALFSAGAAALVLRSGDPGIDDARPPAELAALAEGGATGAPLRPLSAVPGAAALGAEPLEAVEGGIRPAPPERIAIPAAGVDAPVLPVREREEALEVPAVGVAGWYSAGPRPGEAGRAIVIGHLDGLDGPGLFVHVPKLPPGTPISVVDRRGHVHRYRVVGGAQVHKDSFPDEHVYGYADAPVLVLITCGGGFTPGRGYRDNILLYARAA